MLYEPNGFMTSPGYPGQYPDNTTCTVTIDVRPYEQVPYVFVNFNVSDDTLSCGTNYLAVYNGRSTNANLTGKYASNFVAATPDLCSSMDL